MRFNSLFLFLVLCVGVCDLISLFLCVCLCLKDLEELGEADAYAAAVAAEADREKRERTRKLTQLVHSSIDLNSQTFVFTTPNCFFFIFDFRPGGTSFKKTLHANALLEMDCRDVSVTTYLQQYYHGILGTYVFQLRFTIKATEIQLRYLNQYRPAAFYCARGDLRHGLW